MRTTLIFPDHIAKRAKARAALRGMTLSRYAEECLRTDLARPDGERVGDWLAKLPSTPAAASREVNALIAEAEFEKIDPEMWR